ncbi:MAG: sodium:alanine symporter family protein [Victivallales bacterium]|nr:sodium:alanine symporter family protein [Victivallales bacterium]
MMKKICLLMCMMLVLCQLPLFAQEKESGAPTRSEMAELKAEISSLKDELHSLHDDVKQLLQEQAKDTFMDKLGSLITSFDDLLWGWPLIILLGAAHIFLTFRLRFIQRYIPLGVRLSVTRDDSSSGDISQFGALSIALAATIGTGNIIGVATAIVKGGPGAVMWCWLFGVLGIATKYSEALLSVKYRVRDAEGLTHGGPMYAIERGMKNKPLAIMFAVFTVIACFGIGNMTQSNAVAENMVKTLGVAQEAIPTWKGYIGLAETVLIAIVVMGGLKAVSRLCEALVPFMAAFYVIGCIIVMIICGAYVFPAIKLIVSEAFSLRAVTGGALGTAMMIALRYGVARGLFSNESGLGSAPIIAANARTRNAVRQALISSTGTFWDTVIICAMTGICVIAAMLKKNGGVEPVWSEFSAPALTSGAFEYIPVIGKYILMVALVIFAYTTILGWYCYGEQAFHYLGGKWGLPIFRVIFVIAIFFGAVCSLDMVWNISDIGNGLMAIPNLICLFALSKVLVSETNAYLWHGDINKKDPECSAD